jgi:hypothetical protein
MTTIDMTRREGTQGVALVECTDKRRQTYIVRTDIQPKQTEESPDGVTFIQHQFDYKPTMAEVKAFVLEVIDEKVKLKIISGMVWQEKPVWLSVENQLNFAHAIAPVTLKIGEGADMAAIYHEFQTAAELEAFNAACNAWKQQCLTDGWAEKDAVDWEAYEQQLK